MTIAEALDPATNTATPERAAGARMVSTDGRPLLLEHTALRAEARGGLCRVVLTQRFENPYDEALEVTYSLPLPADGAVSGFAFEMNDQRVVGVVDKKQRARERYEAALAQGRTAALLEQVRSSVFTQRVGNLPPRTALTAEVTLDQPLAWLDEGAWEWRFPTVVGPRYMGAPGRVADAPALAVDVADKPLRPRLALELSVGDTVVEGHRPESPSHALTVGPEGRVRFRDGAEVRLDRDVVVRWAVARPAVGLSLHLTRGRGQVMHGLLTMVPPSRGARSASLSRDLIVLLDTSGSMAGAPLAQARRVVGALLDTLGEGDQIELIEFSDRARRWEAQPVAATRANVQRAHAWLSSIQAGGSTEMRAAILDALAPLRAGAQRQVVLVTDGYIGFEQEIVQTLHQKLPVGCRLHTVGVGSSVNRSLTQPAARAGRGVEIVVGNGEDPERAVAQIVARTRDPIVSDVVIEGPSLRRRAPSRVPDLFQGAPVVVAIELDATASELTVRGETARGRWSETLAVPELGVNSGSAAVAARFAREAVEDCEMHLAAGGSALEIDPAIEALGVDFQIATRLTSWVAVTESRTVQGGAPTRSEGVAQELPEGVSAEGVGLRPAASQNVTRAGAWPTGLTFERLVEAYNVGGAAPAASPAQAYMPAPPTSVAYGAPQARTHAMPESLAGSREDLESRRPSQSAGDGMWFDRKALESDASPRRARRTLLAALLLLLLAALAYWFAHRAPAAPSPRPARVSLSLTQGAARQT